MGTLNSKGSVWGAVLVAGFAAACSDAVSEAELGGETVSQIATGLTVQDRIDACLEDPRVIAELVSVDEETNMRSPDLSRNATGA